MFKCPLKLDCLGQIAWHLWYVIWSVICVFVLPFLLTVILLKATMWNMSTEDFYLSFPSLGTCFGYFVFAHLFEILIKNPRIAGILITSGIFHFIPCISAYILVKLEKGVSTKEFKGCTLLPTQFHKELLSMTVSSFFTLFYFTLLFYLILCCCILFNFTLFYFILFWFVLFDFSLFYFILFYLTWLYNETMNVY